MEEVLTFETSILLLLSNLINIVLDEKDDICNWTGHCQNNCYFESYSLLNYFSDSSNYLFLIKAFKLSKNQINAKIISFIRLQISLKDYSFKLWPWNVLILAFAFLLFHLFTSYRHFFLLGRLVIFIENCEHCYPLLKRLFVRYIEVLVLTIFEFEGETLMVWKLFAFTPLKSFSTLP